MGAPITAEVIVVGGGLAGLSAAIYLSRAKRETLVIDEGRSMARWEPDVQNYLGFPGGIHGHELLRLGRAQVTRFGARRVHDRIEAASRQEDGFQLKGRKRSYRCHRLLLATGIFHVPPDIRGLERCLGHSMFFCKDCDGFRVQGKPVAIYGWREEAVEYALAMLHYSPRVFLVTDGRSPRWSGRADRWLTEYKIPACFEKIVHVRTRGSKLRALVFENGTEAMVEALFTTRGDLYYNRLAKHLGARLDASGEIIVSLDMRTSVEGLYAAGCVTPANCQMIIAAGQGAVAAQAINRSLFEQSLRTHSLQRFRERQVRSGVAHPLVVRARNTRPRKTRG